MSQNRVPIWDLHIRPLFRLLDREHMAWMDLWDYDVVFEHRESILDRLKSAHGAMPTFDSGGPWPPEWIRLFVRWIETGARRLDLAKPDVNGYQLRQTFSGWELSGRTDVPGDGYRAWLEIERVERLEREYRLVLEPPVGRPEPPPRSLAFQDVFERRDVELLVVHDGDGRREIRFPD